MSSGEDPWSFLPDSGRRSVAKLGFGRPTPIQIAALPRAYAGESFCAVAPTGTGKTLSYLLPCADKGPQSKTLVLLPTRELAYQVSQMLADFRPQGRDRVVLVLGGHDAEEQKRALNKNGWDICLATPGRLLDIAPPTAPIWRSLRQIVLDEFDRLMDMGFAPQLSDILRLLPARRQTLLFSATPADAEDWLAVGLEPLPALEVARAEGHALGERFYYLKSSKRKAALLQEKLAACRGQALVFVGNREKANHLHGLLKMKGIAAEALHGARRQSDREKVFLDFRNRRFPVLVATDLARRGVDFPDVGLIVNFDAPKNAKDYIHRSGRTARRDKAGVCLTFLGPDDWLAYRSYLRGLPSLPEPEPGFHHVDAWKAHAKRVHLAKLARESKTAFIRREQGLEDSSSDPSDSEV